MERLGQKKATSPRSLLIMVVVFLVFGIGKMWYGDSSDTLEGAIRKLWKFPVTVVMSEDAHNGVIFKEKEMYVFNTYDKWLGRYFYSGSGEDGWRYDVGFDAMMLRTIYQEGIGDVVWGVVDTVKPVKEVEVLFIDRKDPTHTISMKIPVTNKGFIGYQKNQLYVSETDAANKWQVHAVVYASDGSVLMKKDF
ncbi:hypothetical protein [Tumebacillus flagellatus]|uniref:Uncharacterized protein n=1 Tax=Tumebacillus flagellatus TaxID=1157490 RepID=A0A074LQR6_9BACL|nr:hypothetical protein [Tumebacillus flagellatus]KEO84476.1 hypothetical protein EL26_05090 [Tumebacillus flagellatus]